LDGTLASYMCVHGAPFLLFPYNFLHIPHGILISILRSWITRETEKICVDPAEEITRIRNGGQGDAAI